MKILFLSAWHPYPPDNGSKIRVYHLLLRAGRAPWPIYIRRVARDLMWVTSWTLNPKWRHKRRERDAIVCALQDAAVGRWG